MEAIFKKLDTEEVPEIQRKIKQGKKSNKNKNSEKQNILFSKEKSKEICLEFLYKYNFLEGLDECPLDSNEIESNLIFYFKSY